MEPVTIPGAFFYSLYAFSLLGGYHLGEQLCEGIYWLKAKLKGELE